MPDLLPLLPLLPIFGAVVVIVKCARALRASEQRADTRYKSFMFRHMRNGTFTKCGHPDCPSCPDESTP